MATSKKHIKGNKKEEKQDDLLGINELGDLMQTSSSSPVMFDIFSITEDPNQPRTFFDEESLKDLSSSIKLSGVKTPISIREDPNFSGRFIINHGARRFRASLLVGLKEIPAFVDNSYSEYDQVVENIQRESLTAKEIASFIDRRIKSGDKKIDIAKKLGKSNAFVTQYASLNNLPDIIQEIFDTGRSQDVTVINDLLTLQKKHPNYVAEWLADPEQEINRNSLKYLKDYIAIQIKKPQESQYNNEDFHNMTEKPFDETSDNNEDFHNMTEKPFDETSDNNEDFHDMTEKPFDETSDNNEDFHDMTEKPFDETSDNNEDFHNMTEKPFESVYQGNKVDSTTSIPLDQRTDAGRPINAILHVYSKEYNSEGYVMLAEKTGDDTICLLYLSDSGEIVNAKVEKLIIKHIF